jgi:hypothetical protein
VVLAASPKIAIPKGASLIKVSMFVLTCEWFVVTEKISLAYTSLGLEVVQFKKPHKP